MPAKIPSLQPKGREEWRRWLKVNHARSRGVSLVLVKKGARIRGVLYDEAVEEALCYGWIDSRTNSLDEQRYRIHMSPRKPGAVWSQSNKKRVTKLIREGRMTDVGLAKIRAARKDGSWNKLTEVDRLVMPVDLRRALAADPEAKLNFEAFSSSSRRIILYWISGAKRDETRRQRIEETVRLAHRNIKAAHGIREIPPRAARGIADE